MPRLAVVVTLAAASALALNGCALSNADAGSYLTTVPDALEQSSLAPSSVVVGTSRDGFSRTVGVTLNIETDEVTTAQIIEVLDLIAGKIDQPGAREVSVGFVDMRTIDSVDTQAPCEAISSPSITCTEHDTSMSIDDLNSEFGS